MSRSVFLVIAGVLALFFGIGMLVAPGQMLSSMARDAPEARCVLQWMSCVLIAVGVIDILARRDPGSIALRAVMLGNIVLHVLGLGVDVRQHFEGFVQTSGVVMGGIVHGVLIAGFVYYLKAARPSA